MIKVLLRGILKPLSFLPALFMMYVIFSFSAQPGTISGSLSYKVSEIIVESANDAFELHWSDAEVVHYTDRIHHTVRKIAQDRKSTRLNSSHRSQSRMPSSA